MGYDKELPSDIIFEILSRTKSLETLDACKSVSKQWKQIIYESSFMPVYCKRSNNLSGYFIQDTRNNKHVSMFATVDDGGSQSKKKDDCMKSLPDDTRILSSCNQGILCCERRKGIKNRYYTSKPATGQWQSLPNPKLRYETIAAAIMVVKSSSLRYKIVRLSRRDKFRCEMFDSEIWRWTEIKINNASAVFDEIIIIPNSAVSIGNSVNWLTADDSVLEFNESSKDDQSLHKFPLPDEVENNKHKQLVEYQGKLGLTCLTPDGNNIELWLWLRSNNLNYWTKKFCLNIASLEENVQYPSPAGFYNGEIAFLKAVGEVVFYRLQDSGLTKVKLDCRLTDAREIFQFRSDLEPVDLSGGRFKCLTS